MKKTKGFLLTAVILLATAFTFSCSSGGGGGDDHVVAPSSSGGSSSSNNDGGGDSSSSSSDGNGGVVHGTPVTYGGETYPTVVIGTQTWFAKNLNYNASGSKCYDDDPANCSIYGRLYDWATAMGIDASYNSTEWGGSDVKHKGICPQGWHLPSNDDWDELYRFADGTSGTGLYDSPTAGKHLKSKSGWNSYSGIENLDTHGFSALPGGSGYSGGSFGDVGGHGHWRSASENDSNGAYYRYMYYDDDYARWLDFDKDDLFSVRCLQD